MNRRSFLRGAIGLLAAPAIVRVASLMPVSEMFISAGPTLVVAEGSSVFYSRALIRDLLMPGLVDITGSYPSVPSQWGALFDTAAR